MRHPSYVNGFERKREIREKGEEMRRVKLDSVMKKIRLVVMNEGSFNLDSWFSVDDESGGDKLLGFLELERDERVDEEEEVRRRGNE
ncbi:hypothetical protein RIF29_16578 [Crotalaria pallida]|uniref:Uncharacterized protein n=1 Tax=Crotalaria pallida TaxID=3830 RepID=A0AAN9FJ43_CROPI